MKQVLLAAILVSAAGVASAQTASTTAAKPVAHAAAPLASGIKLPPGVPPARGILKTAFSLKYQDVKLGTGAVAEQNKVYQVHYTVWIAADGRKLDSSYDHPASPVIDETGKPVMGPDGKPRQEAAQPIRFIQGVGRVIPGWDQGFEGMKVGGKRRLFIPWQLAYGAKGRPGPDAAHPGVPPKADLIFDVELLAVTEMPPMPSRPPMGAMPAGRPMPGGVPPGAPGHPPTPNQPAARSVPGSATPAAAPSPAPESAPGTAPSAAPAAPPAAAPASAAPASAAPAATPQPK